MNNGKVRVFFAITIPEAVKKNLIQIQDLMRTDFKRMPVKWVERENLHISLKFLGDVDKNIVIELVSTLEQEVNGFQDFNLSLISLGAFPSASNARVLWAGCNTVYPLKLLHQRIEDVCSHFNFKRETQLFSPHITLGRIKSYSVQNSLFNIGSLLSNYSKVINGHWTVNQFQLIKSDLQPDGPKYSSLHTFDFQTNG